ncbi:MAG: hypothetical protein DRP42_07620 [Tenericutes bacterium]|nr:MAG: hypothetical protein DRP42_07620 [Mycoplasmatota bacterium]
MAYRCHYGHASMWVPEVDLEAALAKGATTTGQVQAWHEVAITGAAPCYDGWKFVATLEPLPVGDGKAYNLLMTVPGEACPTSYMKPEAVGRCDHCNLKRNRKQTFVVQHTDGTFKAVGRSCIKDFLGHDDPNKLATWAEMLAELGSLAGSAEDEGWMGGGQQAEPTYDLEFYLGWVSGAIGQHGWVSRGKAALDHNAAATVDVVNWLLDPPKFVGKYAAQDKAEWEADKAACTPTGADLELATEATAWALDLDIEALMEKDGEGYLANVAAVARSQQVNARTAGLAGSIVQAYSSAKGRAIKAAEAKARKEALPSKHLGTPKERLELRVRIERVVAYEGTYGTTLITGMLAWDEERQAYANAVTWFCTTNHAMKENKEYRVKATVKAHGEYDDAPQTLVNRVTVLEAL